MFGKQNQTPLQVKNNSTGTTVIKNLIKNLNKIKFTKTDKKHMGNMGMSLTNTTKEFRQSRSNPPPPLPLPSGWR